MDKIVLFGAGQKGRQLLGLYGDNVVAIIDNDVNKQGTTITEGTNTVPVISIKKYIEEYKGVPVILAVLKCKEIIKELEKEGITNYKVEDSLFKTDDVYQDDTISHDNWIEFLSEKFNKKGMRVLEVGSRIVTGACNRSKFDKAEYVGFDYYSGPNVDIVGDAHKLSEYFNEKFDLIFCASVFEHLAMPWKASIEMIKLLKLGGYVFIETHYCYASHERPWHFFQFSENALDVLFPEKMGMLCEKKGCSNLIAGRFTEYSSDYLKDTYINGMYCHSEYYGKKIKEIDKLSWDNISLEDVSKGTKYPCPNR